MPRVCTSTAPRVHTGCPAYAPCAHIWCPAYAPCVHIGCPAYAPRAHMCCPAYAMPRMFGMVDSLRAMRGGRLLVAWLVTR
eukprot:837241-Pyramimonas_sp.AAC.1